MTASLVTPTTQRSNVALTTARVVAGLLGLAQASGVVYFVLIAPADEVVWRGPFLDVPVIGALVATVLLKLAVAMWPRLAAGYRIRLGLVAVAGSLVVGLVKITLYDEPEGVTILALDGVLLTALLLARRGVAHR